MTYRHQHHGSRYRDHLGRFGCLQVDVRVESPARRLAGWKGSGKSCNVEYHWLSRQHQTSRDANPVKRVVDETIAVKSRGGAMLLYVFRKESIRKLRMNHTTYILVGVAWSCGGEVGWQTGSRPKARIASRTRSTTRRTQNRPIDGEVVGIWVF